MTSNTVADKLAEVWAMPFRPALPMNRANLRCLGLSVGIAIALGGCGAPYSPNDWKSDEIPARTYGDILSHRNVEAGGCVRMIRSFMADGKITYGELEQINDCDERARDDAVPITDVKRQLAQGGEAA